MSNGYDYERGRREAELESRVSVLEVRIGEQNTQILRLTNIVDRLETSLQTREAADRALKDAAETVTRQGLTRREQIGVALMVTVMFASFIVALLTYLH